MKPMSVEEVLATRIFTNGELSYALAVIRVSVIANQKKGNRKFVESLCLAFSVLLAYARGELVEVKEVERLINECAEYYTEAVFLKPTGKQGEPPDRYAAAGARLACQNIKDKLSALAGGWK